MQNLKCAEFNDAMGTQAKIGFFIDLWPEFLQAGQSEHVTA